MVSTAKKHVFILTLLISFSVFLIPAHLHAQTKLSELNPEEYFNFWLGEWDLTWEDADGSTAHGTNYIERVLDGAVIKENFESYSGAYEGFKGKATQSTINIPGSGYKPGWITVVDILISSENLRLTNVFLSARV